DVAGAAGLVGGPGDRLAALLPAAQVLRRAVIGLQPTKSEVRRLRDLPRERERRLARLDAAAVAAHVDLDIDRQRDPGPACGRALTPVPAMRSGRRRRLRSNASRSTMRAGVSTSSRVMPISAGGRVVMAGSPRSSVSRLAQRRPNCNRPPPAEQTTIKLPN